MKDAGLGFAGAIWTAATGSSCSIEQFEDNFFIPKRILSFAFLTEFSNLKANFLNLRSRRVAPKALNYLQF